MLRTRDAKRNTNDPRLDPFRDDRLRNRLEAFLYLLMKDHVSAGVLHGLVDNHLRNCDGFGYLNTPLGQVARELADDICAVERFPWKEGRPAPPLQRTGVGS